MFLSLLGAVATALSRDCLLSSKITDATLVDNESGIYCSWTNYFPSIYRRNYACSCSCSSYEYNFFSTNCIFFCACRRFVQSVIKKDATDKHYVFLGRMAVLAVSVIAMVLAWANNESILESYRLHGLVLVLHLVQSFFYLFTGVNLQQKVHCGE